MQAKYDARNPAALKQLVAGGTKLFRFPKDVMDASFKAAMELYGELNASNPAWKKIYDDFAGFRRDANLWFRFTESRLRRLHAGAEALIGTARLARACRRRTNPASAGLCRCRAAVGADPAQGFLSCVGLHRFEQALHRVFLRCRPRRRMRPAPPASSARPQAAPLSSRPPSSSPASDSSALSASICASLLDAAGDQRRERDDQAATITTWMHDEGDRAPVDLRRSSPPGSSRR